MNLTTEQQEIIKAYGINTQLSKEQVENPEFRQKWTSYLLAIQYNTIVQMIPDKILIKETNRIFKGE